MRVADCGSGTIPKPPLPHLMAVGRVAAITVAQLAVLGVFVWAQQPPPRPGQQAAPVSVPAQAVASGPSNKLAGDLASNLSALQAAVAGLDSDHLHLPGAQKQALADSQEAIDRNLSQALPGLLAGFRAAPDDVGAAFRLYRDVGAVLVVAEHSRDLVAQAGSKAGEGNPAEPLQASTQQVEASWNQLGDWIETRGSADYAGLLAARQAAQRAAAAQP
ncbi:MAG: hypothetical protein ACRD1E_10745, partial [Terriglobales bacterium]